MTRFIINSPIDAKDQASDSPVPVDDLTPQNTSAEDYIHRLPFELLSTFFYSALCGHNDASTNHSRRPAYYRRVRTIRLVCQRWKETVDNSPIMWEFVDVNDPPTVIDMALEKSGGCPLVVDWVEDWNGFPKRRPVIQHSRIRLTQHIGRIKALRWSPTAPRRQDRDVLRSPAPLMEYLSIEGGLLTNENNATRQELFGDIAPRLSHVFLKKTSMVLDEAIFANLQTLSLSSTHRPSPLSFLQLLDVLSRSPTLASFALNNVSIKDPPSNHAELPVVRLPKLLSLSLSSDTEAGDTLMAIVGHIDAPQCQDTVLTCRPSISVGEPHPFTTIVAHLCNAARTIGPPTKEWGGWSLDLLSRKKQITMNGVVLSVPGFWEDAVEEFIRCMSAEVVRSVGRLVLDREALDHTFGKIPVPKIPYLHVVQVTILLDSNSSIRTDDDQILSYFLVQLSKRRRLGWQLPGLRRLRIRAYTMSISDLERLVDMAKARLECPVPLQAIHIALAEAPGGVAWEKLMEELQNTVAEVLCNVKEGDTDQ